MLRREEVRSARSTHRATAEKYRRIEIGERLAHQEQLRIAQENEKKARAAEESGLGLLYPGCVPETGQNAETLEDELASAIVWAKLLKIENPAGTEGQTTLADLCRRIFYEFERNDFKMWNPYSQSFSSWTYCPRKDATFDKGGWTKIQGSDTFLLKAADFAEGESKADPEPDVPVQPLTSVQEFQKWTATNGDAPIALFSSEVVPHEGSR
jgi:hypothetical protein